MRYKPHSIPDRLSERLNASNIELMPPGYSGRPVYRASTSSHGSVALKTWPASSNLQRIQTIHSIASECELLPAPIECGGTNRQIPRTLFECDHGFWEVTPWINGAPLKVNASNDQIVQGAEAIGRLHRDAIYWADQQQADPQKVTESIVSFQNTTSAVSPLHLSGPGNQLDPKRGFRERIKSASELIAWLRRHDPRSPTAEIHKDIGPIYERAASVFAHHARKSLTVIMHEIASVESRLDSFHWQQPSVPAWIHRDLHREHILFSDRSESSTVAPSGVSSVGSTQLPEPRATSKITATVTGIIDWDAMQPSWCGFDLARWIVSFTPPMTSSRRPGDSLTEHARDVLAGWKKGWSSLEKPVSEAAELASGLSGLPENVAIQAIVSCVQANAWITLGNWLKWIGFESRHFPVPANRIAERLSLWLERISFQI